MKFWQYPGQIVFFTLMGLILGHCRWWRLLFWSLLQLLWFKLCVNHDSLSALVLAVMLPLASLINTIIHTPAHKHVLSEISPCGLHNTRHHTSDPHAAWREGPAIRLFLGEWKHNCNDFFNTWVEQGRIVVNNS